ncbi:MAG: hypothetical protein WBA39_17810, partial [Rivularia sp. (in: cyanobacteria)]
MKRQLNGAGIFNFKLIGAIAITTSVGLYPFVADAQSIDTGIKTHKSNSELTYSKRIEKAAEAKNNHKNLIALNETEDVNPNLPASLQKLVDERNYAAEYILTALKASESTDKKLPSSLQKLVDDRNQAVEKTLIALKSVEVSEPKLSLVQKIKYSRKQELDSPEKLVAIKPSQLDTEEQLPSSLQKFIDERNRVINSQEEIVTSQDTQYTASLIEPKEISVKEGKYSASLQNLLLSVDKNAQISDRFKIDSDNTQLVALEPFIDGEKLAEAKNQDTSEKKTDVKEWFENFGSTLVAINVFDSISPNAKPAENIPTLIAKNWTTDNLVKNTYNFSSLIAVRPSFFTDNSENDSSEMKIAALYNSFNSGDNRNQEFRSNNLLASYSKSPFGLPNLENLNPNLAPNSTEYISQFPKDGANSATVKILAPTPDALVDVAATPIIVQFPVGNEVELRVNGELSDRSLIGRTETDADTDLVTQTWYGVSLQNGENVISAQVLGSKEPPATVKIMVRGGANELKIDTVESRIPADGISTATIKGTLLDENDNRSNHDAIVTLATTAGEFTEPDFKPGQPGFQVQAKAGEFTATLKSDLEAKTVRIKAKAGKLEAFTQLQFQTALRPSLMTGVIDFRLGARGTDFYSRFKDFLPEDEDNGTEVKFRSAVFATGAIGEWLVTGAYDSSRSLNEDCNCDNRLFGSYQFNENNYPVYGDSSSVNQTTPSTDSVYLRLERSSNILGASPDYAMWG